jgi:hypothetical protein
MPCNPLFDADGRVVGIVCGPGGYTHLVLAHCPWCCLGDEETVNGFREVYGGYEAPDLICGTCGQYWSAEYGPVKMTEDKRDENIGKVSAMKAAGKTVGPWPEPSALSVDEPPQEREPA